MNPCSGCRHWGTLFNTTTCLIFIDLTEGPWDESDKKVYEHLDAVTSGSKEQCWIRDHPTLKAAIDSQLQSKK